MNALSNQQVESMLKENKEMRIQLQIFKTQSEMGSLSYIGGNKSSIEVGEMISPRTQLNPPQDGARKSLNNSMHEDANADSEISTEFNNYKD